MKCSECGAEIKAGCMFCSRCGAEVEIVSADNVLEDEYLFYFRDRGRNAGEGHAPRWKKLYPAVLIALAGFLVLPAAACIMRAGRGSGGGAGWPDAAFAAALADGDDDLAMSYIADAREMDANDTGPLFWQAWLYGRRGEAGLQADAYREILGIDSENEYACAGLIRHLADSGDFESLYDLYDGYADTRLAGLFSEYMVAPPAIEAPEDVMREGDRLAITAGEGLNVYYTLDGTEPIENGTLYYAPITLSPGDYDVRAVACSDKGYYSRVVSCRVTVEEDERPGLPKVVPDSGEYRTPQDIHITVPDGCTAYYAWNGTPTTGSRKYDGAIPMPEGNNVLSVIIVDGEGNASNVQRVNYIYMP